MKNPGLHIISDFQQGNKDAFTAVYNMHYSRLYFFVKKLIEDRDEAKDITAETFIKLWKLHDRFNTNENIKAFLYITARNACLDYLRYQKKQTSNKQELSYILDQQEENIPPVNHEIKVEVLAQIHSEIENLPTQCRRIFRMAYIDGMKNAVIAATLNLTEQTVRNQKTRAIKILRLALANHNVVLVALLVIFISLMN